MLAKLNKKKIILFFLILTTIFIMMFPINALVKHAFEYNMDEGTDLMKSELLLNGHTLYKDIFSDQPPLFTVTLAFWLKLFGLSVYSARIMVFIFSLILLWAVFNILKEEAGKPAGIAAVILLFFSNLYLPLSVSVMMGLPSLSLAMVSIYLLFLYRKNALKRYLVISGIFLALSSLIKMFTVFILPAMLFEIFYIERARLKQVNKGIVDNAIFLWFISFSLVWLAIIITFFNHDFSALINQLFVPHLGPLNLPNNGFQIIWRYMQSDYDILLLALIGFGIIIKKRKTFLPVILLLISVFALSKYRPIWNHYYLLVSIPLVWLAAIAIGDVLSVNKRNFRYFLVLILVMLSIFRLPAKYIRMTNNVEAGSTANELKLIEIMGSYKSGVNWIFTDQAMFAFYSKMLTPPELTLVAHKRHYSKNENEKYLLQKLEDYKPELVLLSDHKDLEYFGTNFFSYVNENYLKVHNTEISSFVNGGYAENNWKKYDISTGMFHRVLYYFKWKFFYEPNNRTYNLAYDFLSKDLDRLILMYSHVENEDSFPADSKIDSAFEIPIYGAFTTKLYKDLPLGWLSGFQLDRLKVKNPRVFLYNLFKDIFSKWERRYQKMVIIRDEADVYKTVISRLKSMKIIIDEERNKFPTDFFYDKDCMQQARNSVDSDAIKLSLYIRKN